MSMAFDIRELQQEKLRRLENERLHVYKPHKIQEILHRSTARERVIFGGNQIGKTTWGIVEMLWTVGKVHPYRENLTGSVWGRHLTVSSNMVSTALIPRYQQFAPRRECYINDRTWPGLDGGSWKSAWNDDNKILHLKDGSFVEFKTYEQDREAHQGTQRHLIIFDEEPTLDIYLENCARQLALPSGVNRAFTLTPFNYSDWLYNDIYIRSFDPNSGIHLVSGSGADNPYINKEVYDNLAKSITDPAEREARLNGTPTFTAGRVYKDYGEHNYVEPIQIPRWYHRSVVIDPHPEKPTAVLWIAEDDHERYHVYRELFSSGTAEQICNEIIARSAGEIIDIWLIDPSSRQSAGIRGQGSLIDEFRRKLPVIEANNSMDYGIECVRKATINKPGWGAGLLVHKTCPTTHGQMLNYSWQRPKANGEDRTRPTVVKKRDDACDCIRYRIVMGSMKMMQRQTLRQPVALYGR